MDDIDVLRQMNATLTGGIDDAMTLLEQDRVWEAWTTLQRALHISEELYIAGKEAIDELSEYRRQMT